MSIEPGQTLAHYRIVRRIGAGGMGEVYRATDTVLGRDVAIKTLPPHVATDPERVARFRREAHLLASLNHPHIAAIYGFEQTNEVSFLVLELVEGEDLAERLAREALSTRETLEIARQVADALEAAHEAGIIHRDLKPANIKVRLDGTVKVLDFGLAKAWSGESVATAAPIEDSPTLTYGGTAMGVILGTAAYMAPEQARGRVVDRRADIWAFGVVLFEMLTRRPAFAGETVTDTLANVVQRDPDWGLLPADTPGSVRTLLRRCLAKGPGDRLPHIGAARMELADVLSGGSATHPGQPIEPHAPGNRWRARVGLIVVGAVAGAAALAAAYRYSNPGRDVPPLMRVAIELPTGMRVSDEGPHISPDGRYVAVVGRRSGEEDRIWIRAMDSAAFRPLAGTDGAGNVFWSADSSALAFFAAATLKRVGLSGGAPQSLHVLDQTEFNLGGSWNRAGVMLFSRGAPNVRHAIFSLSSPGGKPTTVTTVDASPSERHFFPQWLPDGRRFLFVVMFDPRTSGLYLTSIDDPSRRERILPDPVAGVAWKDQLLFVRGGTLFAQPVDAGMQTAGEPVPIAEHAAAFSVSDTGTVTYLPARNPDMQLTWVARNGRTLTTVGDPKPYRQMALSSDGRIAGETTVGFESSLWTLDARGVTSRLGSGWGSDPVWSPDGTEVVFASHFASGARIALQPVGSTQVTQLVPDQGDAQFPKGWSAADDALTYIVMTGKSVEIWRAPGGGHGAPEPLVRNGFYNSQPDVSPDGRWLAYISNESGTMDVYVAPYRRPEARVRVSPAGGGQPKWRGDSKELFYISPRNHLMSVAIGPAGSGQARSAESAPQVGTPASLFEVAPADSDLDTYAPTPDGQRFLVMRPVDAADIRHVEVVVNWHAR